MSAARLLERDGLSFTQRVSGIVYVYPPLVNDSHSPKWPNSFYDFQIIKLIIAKYSIVIPNCSYLNISSGSLSVDACARLNIFVKHSLGLE